MIRVRTAPDVQTAQLLYKAMKEYEANHAQDLSWREQDALHNYAIDLKVELEEMGYECE